ncbi:MAG TPA: hypothetical protein VN317_02895, partial [Candidatus Methanoperedens sp.]|nr:hypothetical protein [Candidatus Methanoperedens sp.]
IEEGLQATSMRLLSKSRLGMTHRLLPFRIFAAFYLPPWLSRPLNRAVGWPVLRSLCSATASLFLYASRILLSYLDRRDFLIRHHVRRSLRAARWVLAKKRVLRG